MCVLLPVVAAAALFGQQLANPGAPPGAPGSAGTPAAEPGARLAAAYGRLPVSFEPTQGQAAPEARFLARGPGYQLALGPSEAVLALAGDPGQAGGAAPARVRLAVVGGDPHAAVVGESALAGRVNYLIGDDPAQWRTDVPTFARVTSRQVYPGIDLAWYGRGGQLEYDFVVSPGADPGTIAVRVEGAERLHLDDNGDLVATTPAGELRQLAPRVYQQVGAARRDVPGRFVLRGDEVRFAVGGYDRSLPLVIDPVLDYSTYLGGRENDRAFDIAVDADGAAYVTGDTCSSRFPTANPLQGFLGSSGCSDFTPAAGDAFVTKFDPTGSALVYSTFLGGTGFEIGEGIAVDGSGHAYVTGATGSSDFPITPGAFQATPGAGRSAFVAKLAPTGSALSYATYLSGTSSEQPAAIAVGPGGSAYVTGVTTSADFPVTAGALQPTCRPRGAFACFDSFVAKLDPDPADTDPGPGDPSDLVYATFLGGGDFDYAEDLAVDGAGVAHVVGSTQSADFPVSAGAFDTTCGNDGACSPGGPLNEATFDAFVAKVDPDPDDPNAGGADPSDLLYGTYLGGGAVDPDVAASGGAAHDRGRGVAVGPGGSVYVTGDTSSLDFPVSPGAFQTTPQCGEVDCDAFVTKLDPNPADTDPGPNDPSDLVYSTFLGGGATDVGRAVAVDAAGDAFVTGDTNSGTFPTKDPVQATCCRTSVASEVFVTKLRPDPADTDAGPDDPSDLLFSTFLGGNGTDIAYGIALDGAGAAYVAGTTNSPASGNRSLYGTRKQKYPTTSGAFQTRNRGGTEGFVSKIAGL